MRAYVGVTDKEWFQMLASMPDLEEINFWQPSGKHTFRALNPGELFLFKLHSPDNYIVGGGLFAYSTLLPVSLAWDSFQKANGADSLAQMRARIAQYRRSKDDPYLDYSIGCILLSQPFFLPRNQWIPVPRDWSLNIVQGKTYDLKSELGASLFQNLQRAQLLSSTERLRTAQPTPREKERFGKPVLVPPRLGQGTFRVIVTDAYQRRCAVTQEKVLPVLEAAHIKPYSAGGEHRLNNGLLLRSDLHLLFDRGYVTVTKNFHLEVSKRIREEFENGRDYYALQGKEIWTPSEDPKRPDTTNLEWHNENVFRG